uniref:T-box domain-containing protein n=1 Tax=Varanus komodoensis TaxID=61221 RepID=A0A8D2IQ06_VARKO
MQLGEQLLGSAASLPGAPFYPLDGAGGRGGGGGSSARHLGSGSPPPRLDLEKGPKKFGAAAGPAVTAGLLGDAEAAGETAPFAAAAGQVPAKAAQAPDGARKGSPCPAEEEALPPAPAPARYALDGLSPERYYLQSPGPQAGAELGGPCALFPYAGAAGGAQPGSMYQAPGGARYPYGSVLSPPYPPPAAAGSCGGLGGLAMPGGAAGLRAQVFLCNRPLWLKFHRHQTEMIITKQGRYAGARRPCGGRGGPDIPAPARSALRGVAAPQPGRGSCRERPRAPRGALVVGWTG